MDTRGITKALRLLDRAVRLCRKIVTQAEAIGIEGKATRRKKRVAKETKPAANGHASESKPRKSKPSTDAPKPKRAVPRDVEDAPGIDEED